MSNSTTIQSHGKQANAIEVSPEFKKQASKAIASIVAFIVVYLLLMALALVLAGACVLAGFWLIVSIPKAITILIGAGLAGFGVMILVFLVKFLFSQSKTDESDSIEITAADQPRLFEFIHSIAAETGTPTPRKIFISHDVNACVFYNSSFWSMFLPVRKNLKIGLGVVNCLNVSEFKAVIAHEFGHFSQRSMKVGSYTYLVNRIIHDMLFNNNGYGRSLETFSNIHVVFTIFAHITVWIVRGVQWVLRQMYVVVNKSYMALSRQMEFHADLVAATVSGNNNIVSSLQKVEFAGASFGDTLSMCSQLLGENKIVADLYEPHSTVSRQLAQLHRIPLHNGMPLFNEFQLPQPANRVNFKDQWASHPTLEERREYVESFDLYQAPVEASAWTLFERAASLKQQLTKKLYEHLPAGDEKTVVSAAEFEELYTRQLVDFSFPELFKGYFDNRQIEILEKESFTAPTTRSFEELLSPEVVALPRRIEALQADIAALEAIEKKEVDTKTFDFDGHKYHRRDAATVKVQLQQELEQLRQSLADTDKALFGFFYQQAATTVPEKAARLEDAYTTYFRHRREADAFVSHLNEFAALLHPLYSGQSLQIEDVTRIVASLKEVHEPLFRQDLAAWTAAGAFAGNEALKAKAESFAAKDYQYFDGATFMENELKELNELMSESWSAVCRFLFEEFKSILITQASLLAQEEKALN